MPTQLENLSSAGVEPREGQGQNGGHPCVSHLGVLRGFRLGEAWEPRAAGCGGRAS